MTTILEDYPTAIDPNLLETMFNKISFTKRDTFQDIQFQLLCLLAKYTEAKTPPNAEDLLKALLTYAVALNKSPQEEVPVICTASFMAAFEMGNIATLEMRIQEIKRSGPSEPKNKMIEWQNLCKVAALLLDPLPYANLLFSYKQEQKLSQEELDFCMLRLTEVIFFINKKPLDVNALHEERTFFLSSYLEVDQDAYSTLFLFKAMLKDRYGADFVEDRWECRISDKECELFAAIISKPTFTREQRTQVVKRTIDLGADRLKEAIVFKNVPLRDFLEKHPIDDFLDSLEKVLTGKSERRFTTFLDDDKQAIFLLLLAASIESKETKNFSLLLLCLPYCIQNLQTVKLQGPIERHIARFLAPQPAAEQQESSWPSINQVMRHVGMQQMDEPLVLLTSSLVTWNMLSTPTAKQTAYALKACAEFAEGLSSVAESLQDITHHLLLALASSHANCGTLFTVNVLFHLLRLEGKELDAQGPSWTETLKEEEVELFSNLLTSSQVSSSIYNDLFSYYTREGASEKCFTLALHIAPCLTPKQLLILAGKLTSQARRELFVKVISQDSFSEEKRNRLATKLLEGSFDSILLATQIRPKLTLFELRTHVQALNAKIPYHLSATELHKEVLQELYKKPWCMSDESRVYTTSDMSAKELLARLDEVTAKAWMEDTLTSKLWNEKLEQTISDRIRDNRRSPSPPPTLLSSVLTRSASPLLSRESQEVLVVHLKKSYENK